MFMGRLPFITFLSLFALNYFLTPANKLTFKSQRASSPLNPVEETGKKECALGWS